MNHPTVLGIIALVAAACLLGDKRTRTWAIIATVAAGLMLTVALGVVHLSIAGVGLSAVLGGVLAVSGVLLFLRVSEKFRVACSTVVTLIGAEMLVAALHLF